MAKVFQQSRLLSPGFGSPLVKPTVPVVLDRQNRFGRHLFAGYMLDYDEDTILDIGGRFHGSRPSDAYTAGISTIGRYLHSNLTSATGRYSLGDADFRALFDGIKPFTLLFHARADSAYNNSVAFSVSGSNDLNVYLSESVSRTFRVFWRDAGGNILTYNTVSTVYQGKWNIYAYTFTPPNKHKLFINGNQVATNNAASVSSTGYSSADLFGYADLSTQYYQDDDMASFFVFDRDFSNVIRDISNAPYQIFRPEIEPVYFVPAAGGGFSPYWAAGSNVILNNGSTT